MKRDFIDFHEVPERQLGIHARLINWGRWCNGKASHSVSPMFRGYRSTDVWAAPEASEPVDSVDAWKIARAVYALPAVNRGATHWFYIKPVSPIRVCRQLAINPATLAQAVIDGRSMLINRGA